MITTTPEAAPYFRDETVCCRTACSTPRHELYGPEVSRTQPTCRLYQARPWRVFEVFDADNKPKALVPGPTIFRAPRQQGRGGAWMDNFVDQGRTSWARPPWIVNNLKRAEGRRPASRCLLSFRRRAPAMFHEFGHALHGMLSKPLKYRELSGHLHAKTTSSNIPSSVSMKCGRAEAGPVLANYAHH